MSTRATIEKHALGFGLLGFAWPILWIFGRALWFVAQIVLYMVAVLIAVALWAYGHFRSRPT